MSEWRLVGYDTFSDEWYPLESYKTEKEAVEAAKERLEDMEALQPTSQSGGQGFYGIQDRVFIERPDGTKFRVLPD